MPFQDYEEEDPDGDQGDDEKDIALDDELELVPTHVVPDEASSDDHCFLWIVRTTVASACAACDCKCQPWEIKCVYVPHPSEEPSSRNWKATLWKYYHIQDDCLHNMSSRRPWYGEGVIGKYYVDAQVATKKWANL